MQKIHDLTAIHMIKRSIDLQVCNSGLWSMVAGINPIS